MGRPEQPVDPQAGPVERLAWELRQLRNAAGRPSYRELARRVHFSPSYLAQVATGRRLPPLEAVVAYAVACSGSAEEWERRWTETATELEQSQHRCPYPGLSPVKTADADLFFGRTSLVMELLDAVEHAPLTTVFGASGSGKSSLLLAGLIPALTAAGTQPTYLTPGSRPLKELDQALAAAEPGGVLIVDQSEEVFTLCADERERADFFARLTEATKLTEATEAGQAVVLAVRADYYGQCLEGLSAQDRGAEVLRDQVQLPVGPMTEEQLREIITAPAEAVGLSVEADLVASVVAEAAGQPGALPLVAHAMRETWNLGPGQTLTLAGYKATGGVREAIAQTAERLYADLGRSGRAIVRVVLMRLTACGQGTEDTRRRLDLAELTGVGEPDDVARVIDLLAARRLVVVDGQTVDVAHEALIRGWPRLQRWLTGDRDAVLRHRMLRMAAIEWDRHGRDHEFLFRGNRLAAWDDRPPTGLNDLEQEFLAEGRRREAAKRAAKRRRARLRFGGIALAAAVVSVLAVVILVQTGRADKERGHGLSQRLAAQARRQLGVDPELALRSAIQAYEARPTADADNVLRQATLDSRLRRILPTGVEAVTGMTSSADRRRIAIWGSGGARLRLWTWHGAGPLPDDLDFPHGSTEGVTTAALSPDGRTLATGAADGTIRAWDLPTPPNRQVGNPVVLQGQRAVRVSALAFGPDGRLASAQAGQVWTWDRTARRRIAVLPADRVRVDGVAFSPDGTRLTLSSSASSAQIWDVRGGNPRMLRNVRRGERFDPDLRDRTPSPYAVLSGDGSRVATYLGDRTIQVRSRGGQINALELRFGGDSARDRTTGAAFSPDGRSLASVGHGGTLRLWDVSTRFTGPEPRLDGYPVDGVVSALSGDGGALASRPVTSGKLGVWDIAHGGKPLSLSERIGVTVALSSGERRVAEGGLDGTVRLRTFGGDAPPAVLRSGSRSVRKVAFSPDGRLLAAAGRPLPGKGGIDVWRVPRHGLPTPVEGRHKAVERVSPAGGLAISPDGRWLAGARSDHSVVMWDLSGKAPPRTLAGHRSAVEELIFSSDGRLLAGVAYDGGIPIWRTFGQTKPIATLRGAPSLIRTAAFSPDSQWLATTEPDGTARLWRTTGFTESLVLKGFGSPVARLAFGPDGRLTLAFGRPGPREATVRTWQCEVCGPGDQVLALAKQRLIRR